MTLSYELAKELYNGGWKQSQSDEAVASMQGKYIIGPEIPYYSPSLEELIEACPLVHAIYPGGAEMRLFLFYEGSEELGKWCARSRLDYEMMIYKTSCAFGETPQEAVARLWLALRKEKNA